MYAYYNVPHAHLSDRTVPTGRLFIESSTKSPMRAIDHSSNHNVIQTEELYNQARHRSSSLLHSVSHKDVQQEEQMLRQLTFKCKLEKKQVFVMSLKCIPATESIQCLIV